MRGRPAPEVVFAVEGYYDGPESGYASFRGMPHRFEVSEEVEKRGRTHRRFRLSPVPLELLRLVLEQHRLWSRWNIKYRRGEILAELPYPERVLPEDLEQYRALGRAAEKLAKHLSGEIFVANGRFFGGSRVTEHRAFGENLRVVWSVIRHAA
jgi:hypothetical protein